MLIIIRGASGAGKSTVARKVAERLNFAHINVDITPHQMMVDYVNIPMGERLKMMYMNAESLVRNFLSSGYSVVVDGGFSVGSDLSLLHRMVALGREFGEVKVVELELSFDEIKRRCLLRNRDEDVLCDDLARKRFDAFESARYSGALVVDASKSVDEIVDIIACSS